MKSADGMGVLDRRPKIAKKGVFGLFSGRHTMMGICAKFGLFFV
jgi:hypothetical protein